MCALQPTPNSTWIVSPAEAQHLRGESFTGGIELIRSWLARRRQLRALAKLDDRLHADVVRAREAAEHEMARAFRMTYARRHMK